MSMFRMQFLLLAGAVLAGVSGFSFNRNDECPTVQDGVTAFEEHFGTQVSQQSLKWTLSLLGYSPTVSCCILLSLAQIPDGLMDCVLGGDNCPFEDFDDFAEWFETTTGISVGRLFYKTRQFHWHCASRCRSLTKRTWRCWASVSPRGPTAPRWRTSTTSSRRSSDTTLQVGILPHYHHITSYITPPSDEEIAMIENCAESWLQQLGVNSLEG